MGTAGIATTREPWSKGKIVGQKAATLERAVIACKMAGVYGVIENLPEC